MKNYLESNLEIKVGDRVFIISHDEGTICGETPYPGTIVEIDCKNQKAKIQYDDYEEGRLIEEDFEALIHETELG